MDCPKCGYVLDPFDATCPRCARMAHTRCAVCGRDGVVATCEKCRHEVCAECATTPGADTVCNACRAQEQAPAEARDAPLEVIASAQGGYGFFDSIARAFTFLKESVLMAVRDKDLILPSIFSTAVSIVVIGMMLLLL